MMIFQILGSVLLILALASPSVRADDICMGDEEEKAAKAAIAVALKTEKSGKPVEFFVAYQSIANDECVDRFDKNIQARAKANLPKLGRELAKAAEAKGALYSKDQVRADGQTSAFQYFEAIGDFNEANRVMLKVVHAKLDDLEFFKTAWDMDRGRHGPRDPKTGERKPYTSPVAYRQELQKVASANADRLMKAEEKDAAGLSGNSNDVAMATMRSLDKLKKTSDWMKFLPDGDKPAKARAEQRGDTIMKRANPMFTQGNAMSYYKFAESPKAKEKAAQLEKKMKESERTMKKSAEEAKGAVTTEKSEADQKKFNKGKADLEKELGF
ncbi:MAG: hypothetical protein A2X96_11930 [Syntrophobacterales bacterium GWC2_56_13]|nr:MAG: hypothetical protein A2X96_11930 [Syntrophobacterales bacterium GWC2_56_13]